MNFFVFLLILLINTQTSYANSAKEQLLSVKNSETLKTNIFSSKDYYFSQVVYQIDKKFNRKKISRKANFESINNFKDFILDNNFKDKKIILNEWGGNSFSKNLITIKNARKLKNLRKKNKFIVVYAFPKKNIIINERNFKLNDLISFNTKNHFNLPETERNLFLKKINFGDIELLWNIHKSQKKINLNNVLASVNPIEYQKKFEKVYNFNKIKISHLNILPSTKFIVHNVIKNNKLTDMKRLTYLSSICSHNNDFLKQIKEFGITTVNKDIINYKSYLNNYIKSCNGFMSFDKNIIKANNNNFDVIEKKFKSGNVKLIDEIHILLEEYIEINPLSFKAWNYLSAILRFKKKFDLALIAGRVEMSIALNNYNAKQYSEALKSYSKARLNYDKNITDYQKQFLKNL